MSARKLVFTLVVSAASMALAETSPVTPSTPGYIIPADRWSTTPVQYDNNGTAITTNSQDEEEEFRLHEQTPVAPLPPAFLSGSSVLLGGLVLRIIRKLRLS